MECQYLWKYTPHKFGNLPSLPRTPFSHSSPPSRHSPRRISSKFSHCYGFIFYQAFTSQFPSLSLNSWFSYGWFFSFLVRSLWRFMESNSSLPIAPLECAVHSIYCSQVWGFANSWTIGKIPHNFLLDLFHLILWLPNSTSRTRQILLLPLCVLDVLWLTVVLICFMGAGMSWPWALVGGSSGTLSLLMDLW